MNFDKIQDKKKFQAQKIQIKSGFRTKRFSTVFAQFQHLVFEIVGFIAPLSLILEGWVTIHFNSNYVEKKKEG